MWAFLVVGFLQVPSYFSNGAFAPLPSTPWIFDRLVSETGTTFEGLILSETPSTVEFQVVYRRVGRPTVTITTTFARKEIVKLTKLNATDRAKLRDRLLALQQTEEGEQQRFTEILLKPTAWRDRVGGWEYSTDRFTLRSGASEELTKFAVIRIEQYVAALDRYFPLRTKQAKPIRIDLAVKLEDYAALKPKAWQGVSNQALYLPAEHRIICGSNLETIDAKLAMIRARHREQKEKLTRYEQQIRQLYRNSRPELERHLASIQTQRFKIREADRRNDLIVSQATRQLFGLLGHELLHACLAEHSIRLPSYLEEGFAQLFETGLLDGGELRIDHADVQRLEEFLRFLNQVSDKPISVRDLIDAKPTDFLQQHTQSEKLNPEPGKMQGSNRLYVLSWGVTYYLLQKRQLIYGPGFQSYLRALQLGRSATEAFEEWVGQEIHLFDADWLSAMKQLRTNNGNGGMIR